MTSMEFIDKIETREAIVSVVGLGYTGLPLAVVFAEAGFQVIGIEANEERVADVNRGESYVPDVSSEALKRLIRRTDGPPRLSATTSYEPVADIDAAIVCVPTPLSKTKDPDLSHIHSAADEISKRLHSGMLVVLESTTYPGTTEELVLPCLQNAHGKSLDVGRDFFLAFSPERIDPGRKDRTISNTPKVIGGVTRQCLDAAKSLYECVVEEVVAVSSPRVAEMVKMLENTFRATNIGLVNEIAIMCDRLGVDVWEVIEAAKTKPYGYMPFYPGPGLGGHCLPIDPQYLAWKLKTLDYNARFIQLAEEVNLAMPMYWVSKVQDALNEKNLPLKGSAILIVGVAYKRDVADIRESPALDIIDHLLNKGANVTYHDPYVPVLNTDNYDLASIGDEKFEGALSDCDAVVIVTDHSDYDWQMVKEKASVVVDTRNALAGSPLVASYSAPRDQ